MGSWTLVNGALAVALTIVAALLPRAPRAPLRRRKRLRRCAILFVVCLVTSATAALLGLYGATASAELVWATVRLVQVLLIINLVAIALFDLLLPLGRVQIANIVHDLAVGGAYAVAALWFLHHFGVNLSGILATSAVVTAVLGLSLQATLGNVVGGLALQLDESIEVGEWIELENRTQGLIKEIRWRHTVIETRDRDTLIVPNATLLSQTIKVLGKHDGEVGPHRMWVYFNVDFRYPPGDVIRAVTDALVSARIAGVAAEPLPSCVCMDFAKDTKDSFALYAVRYFLTDFARDDPTSSAVRERIYMALRRANVPLAVPAATIFVSQDDPEHAARKHQRELAARITALDGVVLFSPMTKEERQRLADLVRPAPFAGGEVITRQGATAHWLYVLTSGEADVCVAGADGVQRTVAHVRAPDFFGEMGLMTGEPRTATVIATTNVQCLRLDKVDFHEVLTHRPEIAQEFSTILARRRVELLAALEDLDAETRGRKINAERSRILSSIQEFFGLGDEEPS